MLISDKYLFIHIPKNAGSSIQFSMDGGASTRFPDHIKMHQLMTQISSSELNSLFKFAFVRHPWAREVSYYYHTLRHPNHMYHNEVKKMKGFTDYVRWTTKNNKRGTQASFVCDQNGNLMMDFVGKVENIQEDFKYVIDKFGIKCQLMNANVGKYSTWESHYNKETVQLIREYYAQDIEMFGYQWTP